jgi:hypothetical protein
MFRPDSRSFLRRALAVSAGPLLIIAAAPAVAAADIALPAPTMKPGTVTSFGAPADMQSVLLPPAGLDDATAVAASDTPGTYSSLALRADGTVVGWGLDSYGEASVPAGLADVVAIDVGAGFSMALSSDGSVTTWGADDAGQLDVPSDLGPVTSVAAGGYLGYRGYGVPYAACGFALALRPDGTVTRWGEDRDGSCNQLDARLDPPQDLTGVVAISAGDRVGLALKSDGTVVAWGPGVNFSLDGTPPQSWSDVVAISAGAGNMLGLRADGTVLTYGIWGESGPPSVDGVQALSAGQVDLFLHDDSTISAYRPMSGVPTDSGYETVSAGSDYGLAIRPTDNPEPSQPAAESLTVSTGQDTPVTVNLAGTDPDGDPLSYAVAAAPTQGTLSGIAPALTYTPNNGYLGADSFSYTVNDGTFTSPAATVSITVKDLTKPVVKLTAPTAPFTLGPKTTISWTGSDAGTGITSYHVQYRRARFSAGFEAWVTPRGWQALAASVHAVTLSPLATGYEYCAEVQAVDKAGNLSTTQSRCIARPLDDTTLTASAHWTRSTGGNYWNSTIITTKQLGATLKATGVQLDRVGIVATRGPGRGAVGIYVGTKLIGEVNLAAASLHYRSLITLPAFSYRTGTLTVKVLTSGKPVQIDGLAMSRS